MVNREGETKFFLLKWVLRLVPLMIKVYELSSNLEKEILTVFFWWGL